MFSFTLSFVFILLHIIYQICIIFKLNGLFLINLCVMIVTWLKQHTTWVMNNPGDSGALEEFLSCAFSMKLGYKLYCSNVASRGEER